MRETGGMTIGQVAREAGMRPSALRYYEGAGLLPPPRRVGGQRRYDSTVLRQLAVIRLARQAGFTIAETRLFLHGFPADTPPQARWQALARRKLPAVRESIARALTMQRMLEEGGRCSCAGLDECARIACGDRLTAPADRGSPVAEG